MRRSSLRESTSRHSQWELVYLVTKKLSICGMYIVTADESCPWVVSSSLWLAATRWATRSNLACFQCCRIPSTLQRASAGLFYSNDRKSYTETHGNKPAGGYHATHALDWGSSTPLRGSRHFASQALPLLKVAWFQRSSLAITARARRESLGQG